MLMNTNLSAFHPTAYAVGFLGRVRVMLALGLFLSYQYGGIAQAFNYVFVCVAMWFSYLCLYFILFYCFLESDNKIKNLHFIAKLSVAVIVCVFLPIPLG